jgi:uncharacterized protein YbjQ (UPF0145 family)
MILTTTPTVEGRKATHYLGIVSGETIMGANMLRDFFAGITDMIGGRSGTYEQVLENGREQAMAELTAAAKKLGADAVVGISIHYSALGASESMLMVAVSGTAVRLG